jgi:hypothetical protein
MPTRQQKSQTKGKETPWEEQLLNTWEKGKIVAILEDM